MVFDGRGPDGSWQEDGSGTSSSPQSNDMPVNLTNYLNDSSLTGSSSHGPRPQASGPTPPFHTGYNTFFPNNHYGYNHQTPQSGSTLSSELPRYPHTWANTDTQPVDMTHYYSPPQQSPVDASVENPPHRSSPFYVIPPNDTMGTIIQPANHQQDVVQYLDSRRPSFPQLYSPIPQQPAEYPTLPSPPRSNSSYSHPETSPLRPAQHMPQPVSSLWPTSYGRSSRSTSNSTHVTHAQNDVDSHSSIYSSDVVLSGNSSQVSHPAPLAQLPYLAEPTSYISQPRTDGPSFPVPQLAPSPAPTGGNRATRNYSYPQPGRQTRRVSRSGRQSEASGSRVRLDMLPPPAARRPRNENQTKAQKRDAERKVDYRGTMRSWYDRIPDLLPQLQPQPDSKDSGKRLQSLERVIGHLGGTVPEPVNWPKNNDPKKKWDPKSRANAVRSHREDLAFDEIRRLLSATGRFNVTSSTSHLNLLQLVVYVLSEMKNGVADRDSADLIRKFFKDAP